ncbi:regulator of microtubule dynamics protein 3 [Periophthalmus magnuspinnatus]|uniref:regulator of microtubule dynamics protein 3 n=1 Tax=Periophthalmus magnuspinnatus TaxID=409849 RepID=UPI00145A13D1|nr:regulator of microtubule dynamics protein 3 [Periophthalmus magnuspinnatus]
MNSSLGRNGLIGLLVGATAGLGVIAFIIYREVRRRSPRLAVAAQTALPRPMESGDGAAVMLRNILDDQEVEAQQEALAAVEAVVQGLSPDQQVVLRQQLDQVLSCVTSLRSEVAELRGGLQDIALQIIQDVKKGVEDSQRIRRRRHYIPRERTDSTTSSSVYFTASQGLTSTYETSEGGYSTANAESDYTDRETDREEPEQGADPESEGEDQSCATVITLKQHDSQDEDLDGDTGAVGQDTWGEGVRGLQLLTETPSGELALLLAQSDILHTGDSRLKEEGYKLLQDNRAEYDDNREFVWRLARAHSDMYWCTGDPQSRRSLAQQGLEEAELAIQKNGLDKDCHKWFAMLADVTTDDGSMHNKLKSSRIMKEHLDRALALTNTDPVCFYLLAKWCYQVATLNWLEKKAAAALYQSPPSSSLQQALDNFLKAEELSPGFSKTVRLYIAKCHQELGNVSEASKWMDLAKKTFPTTLQDEGTSKILESHFPNPTKTMKD